MSSFDSLFQKELNLKIRQCVFCHCLCVSVFCVSLTDDKVSDQYVVQRPSVRTSKRKDEFIWYDKTSGELHWVPPHNSALNDSLQSLCFLVCLCKCGLCSVWMKWQTVSLGHTLGCFTHWSVWFDWNPFIYFLPKSTFLLCISSNTQGYSSVTVLKLFVLCVCHYSAVCVCLSVACSALVAYQYAFTSFLLSGQCTVTDKHSRCLLVKTLLHHSAFLFYFSYSVCVYCERRETVTKNVVFNVLSGKRASTWHSCLWFLCFWLHVLEKLFLSDHCSKLNISVHQILLWNQTCGCWWIPALPARSSTTRLMLTWGLCVDLLRKAKLLSWRPNVHWQQSSRCFPAMMVLSRGSWCNQFLLSTRYTLTAHSHSIMHHLFLFAAATLLC